MNQKNSYNENFKTITLGFDQTLDVDADGTTDYNEYFEDMFSIETLDDVVSYDVSYQSKPFSVTYWLSLSGLGDVIGDKLDGQGQNKKSKHRFNVGGRMTSIVGSCVCFPVYTKDFKESKEIISTSTSEVAYHYDVLNSEIGEILNYVASTLSSIWNAWDDMFSDIGNPNPNKKLWEKIQEWTISLKNILNVTLGWVDSVK